MNDIEKYRQRRAKRLARRFDDEEENNNVKKGSHGNTRLPFGLCKKMGIDVGGDWTPRDAWDALKGKGVSAKEEYKKLCGDGGKIKIGGTTYSNFSVGQDPYTKRYRISGDYDYGDKSVRKFGERSSTGDTYKSKEQAMAFLRDNGVTKFKDDETGEVINPQELDLPKTLVTVKNQPYKGINLGVRVDKYGHPFEGRGYTVTGVEMDGSRTVLKVLDNYKQVKEYLGKIGCAEKDAKMSAYLKKHLSPDIRGK